MALTITEGNKYSTTTLAGYVIDRLAKGSEILIHLPFEEIMGNSLTYDTITTRSPGAAFYAVGDTWTESTPTITQATATLTVLGGDADVDNFLSSTRSNILDLKGTVLDDKIKSIREKYLDTAFYGVSGTANQFSGLQTLMTSTTYNTVHAGSGTGTALSVVLLQSAIDLITGWKPTHIVMTKQMRRYINVYLDSIGDKFTATRDEYGNMIEWFRGLKIVTDDHLLNTETAASGAYVASTGGANTSIFICTFAPKAICGIQGSSGIETIPLGDLETKDAKRWRIRWYCGLKFEDLRSAAKMDGIVAAGTVTA